MGEDSSCEEGLHKKLEFDQASDHLEKGQYESSLQLLQNLAQHGYKDVPELVAVAEVWLAATRRSCSCTTLHQGKNLDWYLILKVEENDGIDVIKRRYRQLALSLHPDKNKHPKAEGAFKLVSEIAGILMPCIDISPQRSARLFIKAESHNHRRVMALRGLWPRRDMPLRWYCCLGPSPGIGTVLVLVLPGYFMGSLWVLHRRTLNKRGHEKYPQGKRAYKCLSDRDKRMLFDAHRSKNTCKICLKNSGDQNGSSESSVLGEVKPEQKLPEYFESSIVKNDHHKKNKSDDEELQTFRERARARVDALAQAWKERKTKLKEDLKVKDVKLKCSSADKKENPMFETGKYHSPSYLQKRVQSDEEKSIEVPSDNDFDDVLPQFAHARHISIFKVCKDFKQEKPKMTNYRKPTGSFTWSYNDKQIPSEPTNNCAILDVKEILCKQPTCVRECSETSKNLKGLLQKLRSDSRNVPLYHGIKLWRRTAAPAIKNSPIDHKCPETP